MAIGALARYEIALRLAAGETPGQVALAVGVGLRTVQRLREDTEFNETVAELQREAASELRERVAGLSVREKAARLDRYDRRFKQIGGQADAVFEKLEDAKSNNAVTELSAEARNLVKTELELAKQAAVELGEWTERVRVEDLTDEQIARLLTHGTTDGEPDTADPS